MSVICQIEDAEEEKSSMHLKDVIKNSDGVTTVGFGNEETATFSASVTFCCLVFVFSLEQFHALFTPLYC